MMKRFCKNITPDNARTLHPGQRRRSLGSMRWLAAALITMVAFFASVPAYGQIGAQLVTSYAQATQASAYDLPSATYSNNVLYICFTNTVQTSGTAPTVTGVSGAGLTFIEIGTAGGLTWGNTGLTSRRMQAWRALVTSGATTGVITISLDGDSVHGHEDQRDQRC